MDNNDESKRERFLRLASKRTNNILEQLRTLGNCSNRSAYDYTEEDLNKIFSAIEKRMRETRARFYFPKKGGFKL